MAGQTINISVLADTKRFSSSMKKLSNETGLDRLGNKFRNVGAKISGFFKTGIKLAGGFLSAMLALALKGGFERMLKIEDARAKLTGLGHDAKTVDQAMADALASVKGTAFGLDEAATVAASAMAAGVRTGEELEGYLRLVADAATIAGVGLDEMGSILNKVTTSGRAQTQELNQIADRGIPIWQALADHYGVTADELRKMVSSGKVDAETFAAVMNDIVGGSAESAGDTTRGAFANMKAALSRTGAALLDQVFPMFKSAFQGITEWLDGVTEKAKPVGEAISKWIAGAVEYLAPKVRLLAAWFTGYLLPALQELWSIVSGAFLEVWAEVSAAFKEAGKESGVTGSSIRKGILDVVKRAGPIIAGLIRAIGDIVLWFIKWRDIIAPVVVAIGTFVAGFMAVQKVIAIVKAVKAAWVALNLVFAASPIGLIIVAIAALVAGLVYFFTQTETGRKLWAKFTAFLSNAWGAVVSWFQTTWPKVAAFFANIGKGVQSVINWFKQLPSKIKGFFGGIVNWLINAGKNLISGLLNGVKNRWTAVSTWFRNLKSKVVAVFAGALNWLVSAGRNILSGLRTGAVNRWDSVRSWIANIPSRIKSAVGNLGSLLYSVGSNLLTGLWNGISSKVSWLTSKVSGIGGSILSAAKSALGIASPSKKFKTIGRQIIDGLAIGIGQDKPVDDAMRHLTNKLANTHMSVGAAGLSLAGGGSTYAAPEVVLENVIVRIGNEQFNGHIETQVDSRLNTVARSAAARRGVR